jgi:membrane fusion protein, multidrug efflux system
LKAHPTLFVAAAIAAVGGCESKKPSPPPARPTVLVAPVTRTDVALYIEAVATVDGYDNAEIRARVKGYLKSQSYKDGGPVKAGQLLFTIEPADYLAAVEIARASVARAEVARAHNLVQLDRGHKLFEAGTLSQQDLDNANANFADADGQLKAAKAQLDQALINLSYTKITSPIDGVAGLALVRVGNLVGQDSPTLLTTVSHLDPIRVNFPMAEGDYIHHRRFLGQMERRDLAWARKQFDRLKTTGVTDQGDPGVELALADGSVYPEPGVIVAANRQIDTSTGSIQIQALVPNKDGLLRPGSYGRVRIRRNDTGHGVLVVPEKALVNVQGTYSLGVVGPDEKVHLKRVELGPSNQGVRIVESGVGEGDRIVVDGVQKISEGALVDARPAPSASTASSAVAPPARTN